MTLVAMQDGAVLMQDGKVGTGQECCCGCCSMPPTLEAGQVVRVTVDVTFPDHPSTTCPAGTYTAQFNLTKPFYLAFMTGEQTVAIDGGDICVSANLYCNNNQYELMVFLGLDGACQSGNAGNTCVACLDEFPGGFAGLSTQMFYASGTAGSCLPNFDVHDTVCGIEFQIVCEVV